MANTNEKLFTEFPAVSTEKWEEVITADLKGADYERKLVWRTGEGFNLRPYYRAENLEGIEFLGTEAGQFPFVRGTRAHNEWRVHQTIKVTNVAEANAEAHKLLNSGVDSLGFCTCSCEQFTAEDLDTLLEGIVLNAVELSFGSDVAELVVAKLEKEGIEDARISFNIDPVVKGLAKKGEICSSCGEKLIALVNRCAAWKHVRPIAINARIFGNAGSTIVEELAFALSAGQEYMARLTDAGVSADVAGRSIRFIFSVSSNYFMEIAKFRAGRMLWAQIVKAYGPEKNCACKMMVHAETSRWNQSVYDPYVNMLRGTTEAMSAAIAGVNSLEVVPFNAAYAEPDEFAKRIARNVELLLKHESHFDQVVDPAGGSYYIENLTKSIAEEAWKLFLSLEEEGGYAAAYAAGTIKSKVEASAALKEKNIATRRQIILGANQFPNFTEVADAEITMESVERDIKEGNILNAYRGAMSFEKMRLEVDRSGKEPKAFMLTCGSLGMARARAQFSCNFFGCAGIRVIDNTFFKSLEEGVAAALESKAEIVVVCASDDDYAEVAPKIKELLGGKAILVVAGAPACTPELEAQGITNFINVKSNVLETLKFYLKEMGI